MRPQIVNHPENATEHALEGLALTHPHLIAHDPVTGLVTRARPARDKVGLVSGGGSGHEPLHAGFVGTGMLDVAVPGALYASPTALQVQAGTVAADSGRGVVQIVKNYTGDVLNFRIAGELAEDEAVLTEVVLVDDDLATDRGDADGPGRRGTAAVLAVEKICGAAAEAGAGLAEVAALGRRVAGRARTIGLALRAGTHPGAAEPAFVLPDGVIELGVGIHGERGTGRVPLADADGLIAHLVDPLAEALALTRGSSVIAVVNGLGGTSPLELSIAARATHHRLKDLGVTVARSLAGTYVTSLDMHGVSVTLLPADDDLLPLWDAPVRTPALTW
ncbi:dihydroxyacetone kinase subunit DhaK [Streptomyces griseoviridis]|uniref:Dihydroxyacetone kinase subunit DhaK n=1 Tax=Streptomyces hintoniae TaxID=3075521 RepID=A0ABU2UVC8_9ACTN|nr:MULTISPECIES: dihydroxyacetone kinase subunit DhaK [unclassified Streptomyces]MDH6698228.1 dihydroxyacetone kinase-like protein [Streptomyces sp. MAA16]MDT0477244.1 dihydroxyacetone kinase subunit DhaK [Streptomyces sp. DSM 41014]